MPMLPCVPYMCAAARMASVNYPVLLLPFSNAEIIGGTTSDFCGSYKVTEPSCTGTSSRKRNIGYYEGFSQDRPCDG
jgi:hypothetical protein